MSDETVVFNGNAFADKRVALNFTVAADPRTFLYFDERTDFCIFTNFASVKIDKMCKLNVLSQFHIVNNRKIFHRYIIPPCFFNDSSQASSILTTLNPE